MKQIVYFIEQTATGIYLICALIVLVKLRAWMFARRDLSNAEFELERGMALRKQASAITWVIATLEVILAVYAIAHVVAPTLRTDTVQQAVAQGGSSGDSVPFMTLAPGQATLVNSQGTPIEPSSLDDPFRTLTAKPPEGSVIEGLASPTAAPSPVGTIIPGAPPPIGCDVPKDQPPQAILDIPANGQVLFEALTVRGIANTDNFARYKFEISGPSTGNSFAPFGGDKSAPVKEMGTLGQVSLLGFEPGTYQFKLAVFDSKDQLKASCVVTVYLRVHPPTATPLTPTP
jgi:hypothetical protein